MNLKLKTLWEKNKNRVVFVTVFIAGLSAFLTNTQSIIDFFKPEKEKGLKIVDADFHSNEESPINQNNFDTLNVNVQNRKGNANMTSSHVRIKGNTIDIKLRNTGDEIAVIKKIQVNVKNKWVISPTELEFALLESSETHELLIDCSKQAPFILTKNVSHEIEPNKSDRFLLNLGTIQKTLVHESYIYQAEIVLLYNENSEQKISNDFIFGFITHGNGYIYPDKQVLSITDTFTGDNKVLLDKMKNTYLKNNKQIEEINNADAIKSEEVTKFVEMIKMK